MKSEVMKRSMFVMPLSKASRNSGIMQGFEDEEFEGPSDIETKGIEEMPPMARTPQNPEILMNTLRGDMRSPDARYQELAELVGEAAYETPPEVLAMLQPVLAQQQAPAAGIGALPQAPAGMEAMMPPGAPQMAQGPLPAAPEAMPAMPEMPAPEAGGIASLPVPAEMAPQQFADGGIVQRFSDGSDEEGVTPSREVYPPDVVRAAQQWVASQVAPSPAAAVPTLQASMEKRLPLYQELLGTARSKEDARAQLLLDIASRGFALAGNVDEQGRPLRGSLISKFGQVTRTLPTTVSTIMGEQRKGEMAAKQLALQAGEKDIQDIREAQSKDLEGKRRLFTEVLKAEAKARGQKEDTIFGKGAWEWSVINRPGFISNWAAGKTTEDQNNLIASAIEKLSAPRTELRTQTNPVTNQPETITVQVPGTLPSFVREAQAARARLLGTTAPRPGATTGQRPAAATAGGPRPAGGGAAAPAAVTPGAAAGPQPAAGPTTATGATLPAGPAPLRAAPVVYDSSVPNMFNLAAKGTGPVAITSTVVARIPILGNFFETDKEVQANTFLENSVNQLNRSIATNPRFSEGERQSINRELELMPRLIERPEAYRQRLIALDSLMLQLRDKAYREGYLNRELGPDTIRRGREKVDEIDSIRKLLGAPPRVNSRRDFDALPAGSAYILRQNGVDKVYMKE